MGMMSIVIPHREGSSKIRQRNFDYVYRFYKENFPEAEIIIGEQTNGEKWFCRSNTINDGVRKSCGDILLISDADIYIRPRAVTQALDLQYPFVIPFGQCWNINEETSLRILNGEEIRDEELQVNIDVLRDIRPGQSNWGDKLAGGIHIITRDLFDKIGGYDERFIGWGWEDTHFCWKIMKELGDYPIIEDEKVIHLWHPNDTPMGYKNYLLAEKEKKRLGIE